MSCLAVLHAAGRTSDLTGTMPGSTRPTINLGTHNGSGGAGAVAAGGADLLVEPRLPCCLASSMSIVVCSTTGSSCDIGACSEDDEACRVMARVWIRSLIGLEAGAIDCLLALISSPEGIPWALFLDIAPEADAATAAGSTDGAAAAAVAAAAGAATAWAASAGFGNGLIAFCGPALALPFAAQACWSSWDWFCLAASSRLRLRAASP